MFNPVNPSTPNDAAVSQCAKRSIASNRTTFCPERPAETGFQVQFTSSRFQIRTITSARSRPIEKT
ncbi:hypothetical protein [Bradyrhizobium sp. USDA 10063]